MTLNERKNTPRFIEFKIYLLEAEESVIFGMINVSAKPEAEGCC